MRKVTYSMGVSLDGYIYGPDGSFDWSVPDEDVYRNYVDELRRLDVHLMGRRLYEAMTYWDTATGLEGVEAEWAALWLELPKVVFSRTLTEVHGSNVSLASGSVAEEIARWRAKPGDGEIAIGGAELAAEAGALGLIDEYRAMVHPVIVGGGQPFFPQGEPSVTLELVENREFASGVVLLRYRVVH